MKNATENAAGEKVKDKQLWRDLVAYWILGLCNNYGYVVMLSAGHDIVREFEALEGVEHAAIKVEGGRDCNLMSTGVILLADVFPEFMMKLLLPFFPLFIHFRMATAISFQAISFLIIAFAQQKWLALLAIVLTSLSCGIGGVTLLASCHFYDRNVISTWASGTGGAGIAGALSYSSLKEAGLTTRTIMLIMLSVPTLEALSFWVLLRRSSTIPEKSKDLSMFPDPDSEMNLKAKFIYIKDLVDYIYPLALIYFFEYFINQGLFELMQFDNNFMSHASQYRWYFVIYQLGVFISRSSVNYCKIRRIWIMAIFQGLNVVYCLLDVFLYFTPSIWIIFVLILWEGLLGGSGYVNTFYRISIEVKPSRRLYATSITAMSDVFGIVMAGVVSMPVHNAICQMPKPDSSRSLL